MKSRRRYKRFDCPFAVKFRPTYGAKDYFSGSAMDLSCEGLGISARDFRFILYENLELVIGPDGGGDTASVFGDIVWKKQEGKGCLAGINFRMKDRGIQEAILGGIFARSNIPVDYLYSPDPDYSAPDKTGGQPAAYAPVSAPKGIYRLGLIRKYDHSGAKCTVTFRLLRDMARNVRNVAIAGDFNDWDPSRSFMTRLENGDFVISIELGTNREYRFRYLIDGKLWVNDPYADKFVRNGRGTKDSVVIV
ncbi:MAG: PilZ domain-containing protein [Nitrospirae bacterium]|nr:PilZ domain-containing protein [Nitrospirota bacterium]